jgi:hypothetical protein
MQGVKRQQQAEAKEGGDERPGAALEEDLADLPVVEILYRRQVCMHRRGRGCGTPDRRQVDGHRFLGRRIADAQRLVAALVTGLQLQRVRSASAGPLQHRDFLERRLEHLHDAEVRVFPFALLSER